MHFPFLAWIPLFGSCLGWSCRNLHPDLRLSLGAAFHRTNVPVCLSFHLLMGLLAVTDKTERNICVQVFVCTCFHFSWVNT